VSTPIRGSLSGRGFYLGALAASGSLKKIVGKNFRGKKKNHVVGTWLRPISQFTHEPRVKGQGKEPRRVVSRRPRDQK